MHPLPIVKTDDAFDSKPTGRYENFVIAARPCLNEKLGANFCAIPARGTQSSIQNELQIPRSARDDKS
jgi:hypothetical protein